ncbi:MAG: DUF4279 domain-containing protein [Xanthomonadales bacterium]|nr:DUF4279 domain-containing protein [Xanthomonadales bacterium]
MSSELYFCYTASLRIFGDIDNFDEITKVVGVKPTRVRKKGEKHTARSRPYPQDMWRYEPNINEEESLSKHLNALWAAIGENAQQIKQLKTKFSVDIFCGYRSNCDHAGFEVDYRSLTIFSELEIPFNVSVIVFTDE